MSVAQKIREHIERIPEGEPFTNSALLKLGGRAAVDQALSRLVKTGMIERLARGVFVRPKQSRILGNVMPEVSRILEVITRDHDEVIQLHGAEAARRFSLSTQNPTIPVYYTSGPSRELRIGNLRIRLMHTTSRRKLQHAGKRPGMALSALWYLGKENVDDAVIGRIREELSDTEYEELRASSMPAWMASAIEQFDQKARHV